MVVITCWLGDLAPRLSPGRLRLYRRLYRNVDRVVVFSTNQVAVLHQWLDIPEDRIAVVPFGIDTREFDTVESTDGANVVAVGRDAGRDWPTFFRAVTATGWPVAVACRSSSLTGLDLPDEVQVLGYLDRPHYTALIASAGVVVINTHERAYPTGQTVMLEAMHLGKACVVTATPAMADYAFDGLNCLTVPSGDADALRTAIARLRDDACLRTQIGTAAKRMVAERFTADRMWGAIADELGAWTRPA